MRCWGWTEAATLAELARSNLLLVPLDRRGKWYRYHHLFRDMLLAELDRGEPALIPVLRRRAADWCLDNGQPEEALEYAIAAGDVDRAAGLVEEAGCRFTSKAGSPTSQRWIRWLDDRGGVEGHPMVAVASRAQLRGDGAAGRGRSVGPRVDRWQSRDRGPAR